MIFSYPCVGLSGEATKRSWSRRAADCLVRVKEVTAPSPTNLIVGMDVTLEEAYWPGRRHARICSMTHLGHCACFKKRFDLAVSIVSPSSMSCPAAYPYCLLSRFVIRMSHRTSRCEWPKTHSPHDITDIISICGWNNAKITHNGQWKSSQTM